MLPRASEDMFAHKLVALLERSITASRAIYDIWYFLENRWPLNKEIVEMSARKNFKDHLEKYITFIESISDCQTLSGIGDLLEAEQKVWVKNNLRNDTIFFLKLCLEQEKQS
ncbi:MAG: hypothetical protein QME85_11670 [Candidatus Saccharicenans sp.]|nr:hypothetical protein [Candidatus Saccharicenans sp.]